MRPYLCAGVFFARTFFPVDLRSYNSRIEKFSLHYLRINKKIVIGYYARSNGGMPQS
ncbi:MAG: hypothetical protein ACTTKL_07190 [Treponema sp.]